jgi:hypothetical protein
MEFSQTLPCEFQKDKSHLSTVNVDGVSLSEHSRVAGGGLEKLYLMQIVLEAFIEIIQQKSFLVVLCRQVKPLVNFYVCLLGRLVVFCGSSPMFNPIIAFCQAGTPGEPQHLKLCGLF